MRTKVFLTGLIILISGSVPMGNRGLQAQDRINPDLRNLVIVFKTHFDNGYTHLSETVLQRYSTTLIDGALDGIDQTAASGPDLQFAWTLSGYPMKEILRRNPGLNQRVSEAIRKGRFAVHALPFTFETESMTPELLVRGLSISSDIARANNMELPIDAKLTDVPSHSWILPTVLSQAGIRFLHIGCNPASQSPEVPLIFWWEGPDGSRLMTMYWGGYYGTDLVPPEGWPFKSWLAIIHTNDNVGAPTPEEIRTTLKKARQAAPNANITVGRMSDFYNDIMTENPDLPVIRGDMPDSWIHGYFSMPKEFRDYSISLNDLRTSEAVTSLTGILNSSVPLMDPAIARAYEELLLFSEHTFGLAMSHGHSGIWRYGDDFIINRARGDYDLIEHSWKEKGDHVFQARRLALPALEKALGDLAAGVKIDGSRIVVYNPLPYPRSGPVEIRAHSGWSGIKTLRDAETGEAALFSNKDNVYRFIAQDVPGMGYRTYIPAGAEAFAESTGLYLDSVRGMIQNKFLTVTIDTKSGRLVSVIDRNTGMEMISKKSVRGFPADDRIDFSEDPGPFGGYIYQKFDKRQVDAYAKAYIKGGWDWAPAELGRPNLDDRPGYSATGFKNSISWAKGPTQVSAAVRFKPTALLPHDYTLEYKLFNETNHLEITWFIHSKPAEPWPEGGWISFPFNLADPEFRIGRPGGIADPKKDFIKGSNHDYFMANNGVAVYGKNGAGFAVVSPDAPAVSLDKPGLWTWTGNFEPGLANVYFNLYNNQWSTNFTEWIEGSWSARFYVWAFSSWDPAASLAVPAANVTTPMYGFIAGGKGGKLPLSARGIEVSDKNVSVTAFAPDPDTGGYLLRLWETAGKTVRVEIRLPETYSFRSARLVDLRGTKTGEVIAINNNSLIINCPANRPVSVVLN